ncbi:endonuclease MutS2 [Bacillus timonensis]|nr:endonuclease MutS2 [Bacillus timonensis]
MNQRMMKVLEFDKVKEQLKQHVASSLGRDKVIKLLPSPNYAEVVKWQEQTDEGVKVLRLKGNVPLGGISDIRASIKRAAIGGMLNQNELLNIASTIYGGRQLKKFIEGMIEDGIELPILGEFVSQIAPLIEVEQDIKSCIDDSGEVMDSASEKLRTIRHQLRSNEARIREKLENIVRSSSGQKTLSDAIITIRNDRYVVPVKQEYRGVYGGIVHDQSSSGATLFIEPQAVVDLNNQLQEARVKETQEIERILFELTGKVAEVEGELDHNVTVLSELDFLFAKASYSHKLKCSKPIMNNKGYVNIFKARHPLIKPEEVVPNDIELGKEYTTIVITGPNTGGKTVTLKTVGLFTLMAQSGLQIPALDGSEMTVFDSVYADIGDEQSIEQSLSTFSSHMVNIVDILQKVDENSLVLFDELGAGTDPGEGAALAISILDEVYQRGARVIATTHYPELKAYGYNRPEVINASVEFDVDSLSPTYKLLIGVPGRSNAFEISKRLGLDSSVIERARSHISTESNTVENMIASLENSKKKAEEEAIEAEAIRKEAQKLHEELQAQINEFNQQRDHLYQKAEIKAAQTIKHATEEADEIIRELRKMKKNQHAQIKEHELIDAKKRLENATPTLEKSSKKIGKSTKNEELRPGDEVKVISFDQKGILIEKVGQKEWNVQMGIMKMKVKESNLQYISRPEPVETKPLATIKGKDYHVKLELDLRGERFEDALLRVEKYIDDALLAGYPRVSIIHGKGTGALRQGVQDYLKKHRQVKSSRFGEAGEGGTGVTVVEFK